jgi:hypothetical protein
MANVEPRWLETHDVNTTIRTERDRNKIPDFPRRFPGSGVIFCLCSSANDRYRDFRDFAEWRFSAVLSGAPDKIRTCDLCLRRAQRYHKLLAGQAKIFPEIRSFMICLFF